MQTCGCGLGGADWFGEFETLEEGFEHVSLCIEGGIDLV